MSVQIPPEPPDAALVVVKQKRAQGLKPLVIDAFQRNDDLTLGPDKWWSLTETRALSWRTLWLENNRRGWEIYVATGFTNLWSYNQMEYPK
jgi:hypothetical protein